MTLTRRQFHASALAALGAGSALAAPLGKPVGCQLYPVRDLIEKDFEDTLLKISQMGYRHVEMCSPPGYEKGFGGLKHYRPEELRRIFRDNNLACESCHYQFKELKEHLPERISYAGDAGIRQLIIASFGLPATAKLDDWKKACDEANKIGERVKKAGLRLGFHNHDGEFKELDGVLIYDAMLKALDPALVKMQFQVSVVRLGQQAADWMTRHPGRFISLHLQDWSPSEKKTVAVGAGSVDWKALFAAAKKGGVQNYFVELPLEQMAASCQYLTALKA